MQEEPPAVQKVIEKPVEVVKKQETAEVAKTEKKPETTPEIKPKSKKAAPVAPVVPVTSVAPELPANTLSELAPPEVAVAPVAFSQKAQIQEAQIHEAQFEEVAQSFPDSHQDARLEILPSLEKKSKVMEKKEKEEAPQVSIPIPAMSPQDELRKKSHYDTLIQFAAVELDATVQKTDVRRK